MQNSADLYTQGPVMNRAGTLAGPTLRLDPKNRLGDRRCGESIDAGYALAGLGTLPKVYHFRSFRFANLLSCLSYLQKSLEDLLICLKCRNLVGRYPFYAV